MDGVYIVVGHITKMNICKTRYLLYIEDNNIELVERKEINKLVKDKKYHYLNFTINLFE